MVEAKFRARLDSFLLRTEKYGLTIAQLDSKIIPRIIRDSAEETFGCRPNERSLGLEIQYKKGRSTFEKAYVNSELLLKGNLSLTDLVNRQINSLQTSIGEPVNLVKVEVYFIKEDNTRFHTEDSEKIKGFWNLCLKKLNDSPEYQFVKAEASLLLEDTRKLQREITQRIEEPWRI